MQEEARLIQDKSVSAALVAFSKKNRQKATEIVLSILIIHRKMLTIRRKARRPLEVKLKRRHNVGCVVNMDIMRASVMML